MLLYLNGATWTGAAADQLLSEVATALADEQPLLLLHEQRDAYYAVPFATMIARTPPALLEKRVYASLAVPIYDGDEFCRLGVLTALDKIGDTGSGNADVSAGSRRAGLMTGVRSWCSAWVRRRAPQDEHTPGLIEIAATSDATVAASAKV